MPAGASSASTASGESSSVAAADDLRQLLARERTTLAETAKDLQLERAAHDETAEKMVQLQQRLEVALQELANLERFTKQQQQPTSALPNVERLLKEESYLQARLLYVQQELADARGDERPDKPSLGAPETEDDAELGI